MHSAINILHSLRDIICIKVISRFKILIRMQSFNLLALKLWICIGSTQKDRQLFRFKAVDNNFIWPAGYNVFIIVYKEIITRLNIILSFGMLGFGTYFIQNRGWQYEPSPCSQVCNIPKG